MVNLKPMGDDSFFTLFCTAFDCLPDDYNEAVLWLCIFPQAVLLARIIWRLIPDYFDYDFEMIQQIKNVTSLEDLQFEINDFYYRHPPAGFLRRQLHIRLSGERLVTIANDLFNPPQSHLPLPKKASVG